MSQTGSVDLEPDHVSAIHISIVNPQAGDQLVIATAANVVSDGNGHYTIDSLPGGASAVIGNQGTTIDGFFGNGGPAQWAQDLLHAIRYVNTSGAAASSVGISISIEGANNTTSPGTNNNGGGVGGSTGGGTGGSGAGGSGSGGGSGGGGSGGGSGGGGGGGN